MFEKLSDYMVLELILGEKLVHYFEEKSIVILWIIVITYFAHMLMRQRQLQKLIKLMEHRQIPRRGEGLYARIRSI